MLLLTLCLLLCTCGSPKEPAGLALPAAEALQQGYAGLIFSSQAAPAYLLSASDLPRLLTLLAQAEPAALPQAPEVLFRLECLCPDPVETPTRQYLDFCSQVGPSAKEPPPASGSVCPRRWSSSGPMLV